MSYSPEDLKVEITELRSANERLKGTLMVAREEIASMRAQIEAASKPPAQVGTVLSSILRRARPKSPSAAE